MESRWSPANVELDQQRKEADVDAVDDAAFHEAGLYDLRVLEESAASAAAASKAASAMDSNLAAEAGIGGEQIDSSFFVIDIEGG